MAAKCFQAVLNDAGVTAESNSDGGVLFLVCALGAALASDSSDDALSNPYSELRRRLVGCANGKRCQGLRQTGLENLIASLENRYASRPA
jgi:hypothetical protein